MFSRNGSNTDRPTVFEPATYRIIYRDSPGGAAELRMRAKSAIVDCLFSYNFLPHASGTKASLNPSETDTLNNAHRKGHDNNVFS